MAKKEYGKIIGNIIVKYYKLFKIQKLKQSGASTDSNLNIEVKQKNEQIKALKKELELFKTFSKNEIERLQCSKAFESDIHKIVNDMEKYKKSQLDFLGENFKRSINLLKVSINSLKNRIFMMKKFT